MSDFHWRVQKKYHSATGRKDYSLKEASKALGVSQNSLWRKKFTKGSTESDLEKEDRRLRKELERINLEREILKKALGYFAAEDPKWSIASLKKIVTVTQ